MLLKALSKIHVDGLFCEMNFWKDMGFWYCTEMLHQIRFRNVYIIFMRNIHGGKEKCFNGTVIHMTVMFKRIKTESMNQWMLKGWFMEDSITKKRCQKSAFWLVHKTEDFEKKKHGTNG